MTPASNRERVLGKWDAHLPALAMCVLLFSARCAAQSDRPVGILVEVRGSVTIKRGKGLVAESLMELMDRDTVQVGRNSGAEVVLYRDGAHYGLGPNAVALVRPQRVTGIKPGASAIRALKPMPLFSLGAPNGRLERSLVSSVRSAAPDSIRPLTAHGIRDDSPLTLRWQGPLEAKQVRFVVYAGAARTDRPLLKVTLNGDARQYVVPPGKITPGHTYLWTLASIDSDGEVLEQTSAFLRVLLPEERERLKQFEKQIALTQQITPRATGPWLLQARTYEQIGLLDEARRCYLEASKRTPDDPAIQKALQRLDVGDIVDEKADEKNE